MEFKQSVGYVISNTGRKLNHKLQQLFQEHDVTPEQWSLLMCLDEHDGITHKDLAHRTDKDPANITRLVDQLERKELVRRVANPGDRRSQLLYLTQNGRTNAHALAPIEAFLVTQMLKDISEEEIQAFMSFMAKIKNNVEQPM
ncbi:MarR family winged helix-turn-helix transcriptional regulator [Paenibacillus sp. FJAT-27812]|uniref:MarR family winged helix-turn-helix transcriptional regulator n=1 Tax=Paenibacillus sp. FJAT-27812 TaxID=1684143 RepID=UPI0006A79BB2|nr:MarR family transcriptional regulator [Paenibacillus sp. FJAT-27812]